jgi:hypothetical protein
MAAGAAAASAAAAAIAQASKASGVIVRLDPEQFLRMLGRQRDPLVVHATGGVIKKNYQYLASYKGLAFFTKSAAPLHLPAASEVVLARIIWIPG